MLEGMAQEAARQPSALVTVLLVDILLGRLAQVQQRLTASHVVPIATALAAVLLASALATVR